MVMEVVPEGTVNKRETIPPLVVLTPERVSVVVVVLSAVVMLLSPVYRVPGKSL